MPDLKQQNKPQIQTNYVLEKRDRQDLAKDVSQEVLRTLLTAFPDLLDQRDKTIYLGLGKNRTYINKKANTDLNNTAKKIRKEIDEALEDSNQQTKSIEEQRTEIFKEVVSNLNYNQKTNKLFFETLPKSIRSSFAEEFELYHEEDKKEKHLLKETFLTIKKQFKLNGYESKIRAEHLKQIQSGAFKEISTAIDKDKREIHRIIETNSNILETFGSGFSGTKNEIIASINEQIDQQNKNILDGIFKKDQTLFNRVKRELIQEQEDRIKLEKIKTPLSQQIFEDSQLYQTKLLSQEITTKVLDIVHNMFMPGFKIDEVLFEEQKKLKELTQEVSLQPKITDELIRERVGEMFKEQLKPSIELLGFETVDNLKKLKESNSLQYTKFKMFSDSLKLVNFKRDMLEQTRTNMLNLIQKQVLEYLPITLPKMLLKTVLHGIKNTVGNLFGTLWSKIKSLNPWSSLLDFILSPAGILVGMVLVAWFKTRIWPIIQPLWDDIVEIKDFSKKFINDFTGWWQKQFPNNESVLDIVKTTKNDFALQWKNMSSTIGGWIATSLEVTKTAVEILITPAMIILKTIKDEILNVVRFFRGDISFKEMVKNTYKIPAQIVKDSIRDNKIQLLTTTDSIKTFFIEHEKRTNARNKMWQDKVLSTQQAAEKELQKFKSPLAAMSSIENEDIRKIIGQELKNARLNPKNEKNKEILADVPTFINKKNKELQSSLDTFNEIQLERTDFLLGKTTSLLNSLEKNIIGTINSNKSKEQISINKPQNNIFSMSGQKFLYSNVDPGINQPILSQALAPA
jgi:hypothetical protein